MAQPGPGNYDPSGYPPPPQQGYGQPYSPPPPGGNGYYNESQHRGRDPGPQHQNYDPHTGYPVPPGFVPPHKPPPGPGASYDPNNFPPPPRQERPDDGYSEYDHHYDRAPPSDYSMPPAHSGYGNDGRGYDGQLTPYDENRAQAEYARGYEQQQRYGYGMPPPPPSDEELRRRHHGDRRYDDRSYYDDGRSYYDDRDRRSYYDDRSSYDSRDRDRRRDPRRRDSRNSPPKTSKADIFGQKEGERGFGAQILGGAAGGVAGHEFGGGLLETLGGVVAGAIGAKILENQVEKRKGKKEEEGRRGQGAYRRGSSRERGVESSTERGTSRGARERRRSVPRRDSDSYSSDGSPPPRRRG